jgi:glycerophosphoryl diester phosphodiesterase
VGAFRRAVWLGAHGVELDVRRLADGTLAVHHDPTLPDGRPLHLLRAGDLPPAVPTLDEALDACGRLIVNVEIKNDPDEPGHDPTDALAVAVAAVLQERAAAGSAGRFLVSSFDLATVDHHRAAAPTIDTAWLVVLGDEATVARAADHGHAALHPWVGSVTPALLDACHGTGLALNTWTCDDPERIRELVGWGVDGICTDVPDVALAVLRDAAASG